jgi:hypothetical protein
MILGKMEVGRAAVAAPVKYGAKVRFPVTLPNTRPYVSSFLQPTACIRSFFPAENQRSFYAEALFLASTFGSK